MNIDAMADRVYDSLFGNLRPEDRLPWVEEIFIPGHSCFESYQRMSDAWDRFQEHFGPSQLDIIVDIVDALTEHSRIVAMEMFKYGVLYQRQNRK